jgi:hypothetical protein
MHSRRNSTRVKGGKDRARICCCMCVNAQSPGVAGWKMAATILGGCDTHCARGAHPEMSPLRACEVQCGKFYKHYREIGRFIWEDTDPSGWYGGQGQAAGRVNSSPRALPATPAHPGAPGQAADRASNLSESRVYAQDWLVTTVFPAMRLRRSPPVPEARFVWPSFTWRK